jgi:hypothetical protein
MRPLMIAFLILSPFIAIAQNYHLHATIPVLTQAPVAHFAQVAMANAGTKMADMLHAVQELLG